MALAAGCGTFEAVPISASATSAQVAATIAVPSTVAGRESAGRSRGAANESRNRERRGGVVVTVETSGSQVVSGSVVGGSTGSSLAAAVQSVGSHGADVRGGTGVGAASRGGWGVGAASPGGWGVTGAARYGSGATGAAGGSWRGAEVPEVLRCLASHSSRSWPASAEASESALARSCSPDTRRRGT